MKYTEVTAQRKSADRFYSIWAVCFLLHENREEERVGVCRASSPWPAARCSAACWSSARTSARTPAFPEQLGNHRRQREETDNIHDSWKKTWLQASRQQAQEIKTVRFNWKHAREQRNMSGMSCNQKMGIQFGGERTWLTVFLQRRANIHSRARVTGHTCSLR